MVYRLYMSTKHICSTIFPIMYLPDLPLAIFQCLQQNRRSTARIIVIKIGQPFFKLWPKKIKSVFMPHSVHFEHYSF